MNEIFKNIEDYSDYKVSNLGNVISVKYGKTRILKQRKTKNGYLRVALYKDNCYKNFYVHQLVAKAFIPNPNDLLVVNHINEKKNDNRVCNLEWCTKVYNDNYGTRNKRGSKNRTNHKKISKPIKQYTLNGEFMREWPSISEIRRKLGFNDACIIGVCKGKFKQSYGYVWKYAS